MKIIFLLKEIFFFRVQEILAELQFSFLCFLVGQHYDSFEHWKRLLIMLCTCEDAIGKIEKHALEETGPVLAKFSVSRKKT